MPRWILAGLVVIAAGAGAGPATAAPPANDTRATATVIDELPYTAEVDTTEATIGEDDAAIGCPVDPGTETFSHSVWFAYTPAEDQTIGIDTSASSYAVAGAVFPADDPALPNACFIGGTTTHLAAGVTYLIDLVAFGEAAGGTLRLAITELEVPEPQVTLDPIGRVDRAGAATLRGTFTCEPGSFVWLDASFTQVIGRRTAVSAFGGMFGEELICDGTPQAWSVTLVPFEGRLRQGPGSASVMLFECRDLCGLAEVERSVVLRTAP
jgi:hypothetical protein